MLDMFGVDQVKPDTLDEMLSAWREIQKRSAKVEFERKLSSSHVNHKEGKE